MTAAAEVTEVVAEYPVSPGWIQLAVVCMAILTALFLLDFVHSRVKRQREQEEVEYIDPRTKIKNITVDTFMQMAERASKR